MSLPQKPTLQKGFPYTQASGQPTQSFAQYMVALNGGLSPGGDLLEVGHVLSSAPLATYRSTARGSNLVEVVYLGRFEQIADRHESQHGPIRERTARAITGRLVSATAGTSPVLSHCWGGPPHWTVAATPHREEGPERAASSDPTRLLRR